MEAGSDDRTIVDLPYSRSRSGVRGGLRRPTCSLRSNGFPCRAIRRCPRRLAVAAKPILPASRSAASYRADRALRSSVRGTAADYVHRSRQGLGRSILFVHALKMKPFPSSRDRHRYCLLISGVVTESVFHSGLGRYVMRSCARLSVIRGVVPLFSFLYVLVNLMVDSHLLIEGSAIERLDAARPYRRPRHAPQLPDLMLPVKIRRGTGLPAQSSTVAIGGALLICCLDGASRPGSDRRSTRSRPPNDARAPSADYWFSTDVLGATFTRVIRRAGLAGRSRSRNTGLARRLAMASSRFRAVGGWHHHALHGRADVVHRSCWRSR